MRDQMTSRMKYQQMSKLLTKNYIHRLTTPDSISILPELDIQDNLRILDVGCGNGKLLFKLASFLPTCEFHGIDINPGIIKKNQSKSKYPNINFQCGPAEDLPYEADYFDIVICTNGVPKFPQRVRSLDQMNRVLKPDGKLYLLVGFNSPIWKEKFDKILRQCKFIRPKKKYLVRTALFNKSYFIHYVK